MESAQDVGRMLYEIPKREGHGFDRNFGDQSLKNCLMFALYITSVYGYHFYLSISIPTFLIIPACFMFISFNLSFGCLERKAVQDKPRIKVWFMT